MGPRLVWGFGLVAAAALLAVALPLLRQDSSPTGLDAPSAEDREGAPLPPSAPASAVEPPVLRDAKARKGAGGVEHCSELNWAYLDLHSGKGPPRQEGGTFWVEARAWKRRSMGTQAALASWLAECRNGGAAVRILAEGSEALLGSYDPRSGFRPGGSRSGSR